MEKEESASVEQMPPNGKNRVGTVVTELEISGLPFVKERDFRLKRKIKLEKFTEFHYSIGKECQRPKGGAVSGERERLVLW